MSLITCTKVNEKGIKQYTTKKIKHEQGSKMK
jgi:hypothetical protein